MEQTGIFEQNGATGPLMLSEERGAGMGDKSPWGPTPTPTPSLESPRLTFFSDFQTDILDGRDATIDFDDLFGKPGSLKLQREQLAHCKR